MGKMGGEGIIISTELLTNLGNAWNSAFIWNNVRAVFSFNTARTFWLSRQGLTQFDGWRLRHVAQSTNRIGLHFRGAISIAIGTMLRVNPKMHSLQSLLSSSNRCEPVESGMPGSPWRWPGSVDQIGRTKQWLMTKFIGGRPSINMNKKDPKCWQKLQRVWKVPNAGRVNGDFGIAQNFTWIIPQKWRYTHHICRIRSEGMGLILWGKIHYA